MASKPASQPRDRSQLAKIVGGAAAMLAIAFVGAHEGKRNDPYYDIVHVQTVCYGQTNVAMRHYSDDECADMLDRSLATYAEPVLRANPELIGHPPQIAAATSLAYNIGVANYRRSTVSRRFRAGRWRAACDAFLMWDKPRAILNRRRDERRLCLQGL